VSSYFIGYSERSRGYKFYDPKLKTIFETRTDTFFKDIEFGGKNKVKDFVLEEESVTILELIHTAAFDKANLEPLQGIVIESPTQDNLVVHEEQTQDPQEPMLHEPIPLQRSTRERRSTILDDYVVFLKEHEENNGMMEDDSVTFHQVMQDSNSEKWIEAMNGAYKSMQDNKVWGLVLCETH